MLEDSLDHRWVLHERNNFPAAMTVGALQNVDFEHTAHEFCPRDPAIGTRTTGSDVIGLGLGVVIPIAPCRHDLRAPFAVGGQDAVIANQVAAWPRNQGRKALEEFNGL